MKIPRKDFLSILKKVSPALSNERNQVKELSHFWFSGSSISSFNDILAIQIDFKSDFTGGINGDKLVKLLEKSLARTITIEKDQEKDWVTIIASTTNLRLPLLPIEDWFWHPVIPDETPFAVNKGFLEAIEMTLLSVGNGKVLTPEQRGITVVQNIGNADLYSTDAVSVCWSKVYAETKILSKEPRCIFPTPFCQQLTGVNPEGSKLYTDESSVYCTSTVTFNEETTANILIYSKLVEDDEPVPFQDTVEKYTKGSGSFTIPPTFKLSLDRVSVLLSDGEPADIELIEETEGRSKGKRYLSVYAKTPYGEIDDQLPLEDVNGHPNKKTKGDATLLKRGLSGRVSMSITDDCFVLTGPKDFYYIVSTKS